MFSKCLVKFIDEEALKRFGDYSKFAREAFKGYSNPAGAWRAVRNPRENGKSRNLGLADLLNISTALDMPLSVIFFQVEQRIKMGWPPEAASPIPPGKAKIRKRETALPGGGESLQADLAEVRDE